jgi:hypothetical protein
MGEGWIHVHAMVTCAASMRTTIWLADLTHDPGLGRCCFLVVGDTPYSGNSVTSVPVTPYTTSADVNVGAHPPCRIFTADVGLP